MTTVPRNVGMFKRATHSYTLLKHFTLSGFYDESSNDHMLHDHDNRLIVSILNCISLFVACA